MRCLHVLLVVGLLAGPATSQKLLGLDLQKDVIEPALEAAQCAVPCMLPQILSNDWAPLEQCFIERVDGIGERINQIGPTFFPGTPSEHLVTRAALALLMAGGSGEPEICGHIEGLLDCVIEHVVDKTCKSPLERTVREIYRKVVAIADCGTSEKKELVRCYIEPVMGQYWNWSTPDPAFFACASQPGFQQITEIIDGNADALCYLDQGKVCLDMIAPAGCGEASIVVQETVNQIKNLLQCGIPQPQTGFVCVSSMLTSVMGAMSGIPTDPEAFLQWGMELLPRDVLYPVEEAFGMLGELPITVSQLARTTCRPLTDLVETLVGNLGALDCTAELIPYIREFVGPVMYFINDQGCCKHIYRRSHTLDVCEAQGYPPTETPSDCPKFCPQPHVPKYAKLLEWERDGDYETALFECEGDYEPYPDKLYQKCDFSQPQPYWMGEPGTCKREEPPRDDTIIIIVAPVVGGLVFIALLCCIIIFACQCMRPRRKRKVTTIVQAPPPPAQPVYQPQPTIIPVILSQQAQPAMRPTKAMMFQPGINQAMMGQPTFQPAVNQPMMGQPNINQVMIGPPNVNQAMVPRNNYKVIQLS